MNDPTIDSEEHDYTTVVDAQEEARLLLERGKLHYVSKI